MDTLAEDAGVSAVEAAVLHLVRTPVHERTYARELALAYDRARGEKNARPSREARLRHQARQLGLTIKKSRVRSLHLSSRGLWLTRDNSNSVQWGADWELTLDQVDAILQDVENKERARREMAMGD